MGIRFLIFWSVFEASIRELVQHQTQKVSVDLRYTTTSEPSVSRTLRSTRTLMTALPFSVNVEDFFRGKRYTSQYQLEYPLIRPAA